MRKLVQLTLILCVGTLLNTQLAHACRYNVRDVGFVDLQIGSHYLFAFVDKDTPAPVVTDLENIMNAALTDSTVYAEIVHVEEAKGHPALEFLQKHNIESLPAAVLIAPDERSRPVPIDTSGDGLNKNFTAQLQTLLDSPKRKEILAQVTKAYGVVLLIEGKDADQNNAARKAAQAAIETIEMHMDFLPKAIEKPPVLVALAQKDFDAEHILLWSLGLEPDKIQKPHLAMLFGRSRQLGPILTEEDLTEDIITNILSIIGADCECGLDRRWMQGTMIPVKWSEKTQSELVKSLGFDPENPMVKMEISMILRKGPMSPGAFDDIRSFGAAPFGYQEIEVEFEDVPEETGTETAEPNQPPARIVEEEPQTPVEEPETAEVSKPEITEPVETVLTEDSPMLEDPGAASLKMLVLIVSGVCVAVLTIGVGILLRARR
jgi:hypothetical protein